MRLLINLGIAEIIFRHIPIEFPARKTLEDKRSENILMIIIMNLFR